MSGRCHSWSGGPTPVSRRREISSWRIPRASAAASVPPIARPGAFVEKDQTAKVWEALQNPDKYCVVQIAPAVRVAIGEAFGFHAGKNLTKKLYALLRRLGFKAVFDTNFGADVTIMEEAQRIRTQRFTTGKGPLPLITTCCPAWVDFMEKFHPDMIDHFSSCKSPHEIVGVLSKTYYARRTISIRQRSMVSIMPCTAKKYEITRSDEMFASGKQDIDVAPDHPGAGPHDQAGGDRFCEPAR